MCWCEEMRSRAAWAQDWQCLNTAVFDNGSEVQTVLDLRARNNRTAEEEAILRAADKSGNIHLCRKAAGNAFLIMYQGRPAVITAAHIATERNSNKLKCSEAEMRSSKYYPDVSYYNPAQPNENKELYTRGVELEYPPVNFDEALVNLNNSNETIFNDYMIFFLKEDITQDTMPAGHQRSYYRVAQDVPRQGQGMISIGSGLDPNRNKASTFYHSGCNFTRSDNGARINHDCNSIRGASGSVLGIMENGEVAFAGLIQGARIGGDVSMPGPSSIYEPNWNYGVSSSVIFPD